jgi:hypothetical protein
MGGFPAGVPLEPGRYRPHPGFDIQFVIDLGEGWRSIRDDSIGVISLVTDETNSIGHATHWLSFLPAPPDVTSGDLLTRIETQPKILPAEGRDVSIGGATGVQVDARAEPNPSERYLGTRSAEDQLVVWLDHVHSALEALFHQQDEPLMIHPPVARLRRVGQGELHASIAPGQADRGLRVEPARCLVRPGEDLDRPVGELDHCFGRLPDSSRAANPA